MMQFRKRRFSVECSAATKLKFWTAISMNEDRSVYTVNYEVDYRDE